MFRAQPLTTESERLPEHSSAEPFLPPHVRAARAAHAVRFELGLDDTPIADLWALIAARGVDLAFHDFGAKGGDGLYLWNGGRGLVVVNSHRSKEPLRQRFTAAHELGHHEMHRVANEKLLVADKDVDHETDDVLEIEAQAFAANLIAPDRALKRELADKAPEDITPLDVVRLMGTYGLSYTALLNRLVNSGCIRQRERDQLLEQKGTVAALVRFNKFDPAQAFPTGPPLPEGFVLDLLDLHGCEVISDDRLATLLRVSVAEARELAASQARIGQLDTRDTRA